MKKIVSFLLVAVMLVGIVPTAFAAETDWQNGTIVTYTANQSEAYTVTVPAEMAPGETGTVKLTGTWDSSKTVKVTADSSVVLTNNISGGDAKTLAITFDGIELKGSNTGSVSATGNVSVAGIDNALFGTWSGKFNYYVEVTNNGGTVTPDQPQEPETHTCVDVDADLICDDCGNTALNAHECVDTDNNSYCDGTYCTTIWFSLEDMTIRSNQGACWGDLVGGMDGAIMVDSDRAMYYAGMPIKDGTKHVVETDPIIPGYSYSAVPNGTPVPG